jgi:CHAT domain-containing protein
MHPWSPLPGTAEEIRRVERIVATTNRVLVLQSAEATESRVLDELPRSRFVHLATHGFFAAPHYVSALSSQPTDRAMPAAGVEELRGTLPFRPGVLNSVIGRNPLTLSGIVLAGANRPRMRDAHGRYLDGDGILTAEELAGLDMSATELVVLSACETGLGEVAGGEGVMGLQRAFALAGARSVISTLWSVEDAASLALMSEFYRELWQNKRGKAEALRQAQLTMLRRYDVQAQQLRDEPENEESLATDEPLPPFYWAAFTLSGDWR